MAIYPDREQHKYVDELDTTLFFYFHITEMVDYVHHFATISPNHEDDPLSVETWIGQVEGQMGTFANVEAQAAHANVKASPVPAHASANVGASPAPAHAHANVGASPTPASPVAMFGDPFVNNKNRYLAVLLGSMSKFFLNELMVVSSRVSIVFLH